MGVAQWLTLLVPPVLAIKPKKRGRPETTLKKATKRRQLLEKHTPEWTPEDASQPEEGQTSRRPAKKTNRTQEAMEKGPAGQKPIKIKLCKQDQEPEDFIRRIHQEAIDKEVEEEPAETLV